MILQKHYKIRWNWHYQGKHYGSPSLVKNKIFLFFQGLSYSFMWKLGFCFRVKDSKTVFYMAHGKREFCEATIM